MEPTRHDETGELQHQKGTSGTAHRKSKPTATNGEEANPSKAGQEREELGGEEDLTNYNANDAKTQENLGKSEHMTSGKNEEIVGEEGQSDFETTIHWSPSKKT